MTDLWPDRLTPRAISFTPALAVRRGPRSFAGVAQHVASDAGFWRARLTEIDVRGDKVKLIRAMIARMQGGLEPVLLGPFDCAHGPLASGAVGRVRGIPYSDGALFSDGGGFVNTAVLAETTESVELRETELTMALQGGLQIEAGQYFSLPGDRLHIVTSAVEYAPANWTVQFWPPARGALAGAQPVELAQPRCKMRLSSDVESLDLDMLRFGKATLDFEEAP